MFFASKLQENKIYDVRGNLVGSLKDLIISLSNGYPPVTGIVSKSKASEDLRIPWNRVRSFEESEIFLACSLSELQRDEDKGEVYLIADVLDKQILDTKGRKLIRVQDIQVARVEGKLRVMAADVSFGAILRRIGFKGFKKTFKPKLIDWKNLSFLGVEQHDIKLKVVGKKLELLHPADIADIVSSLSPEQRSKLLEVLDENIAADTIEEMHPDHQAKALAGLEARKATEILAEMAPDEAADLVADLPPEKASELLGMMKVDEAYEIRELLRFPENSAGGIMTTEFISVPENSTAQETMKRIRDKGKEFDTLSYVYVVDGEGMLKGVFSLKDLIIADPRSRVKDFMQSNIISVGLLEKQTKVARLVAKYDILAVPVIDDKRRIRGVVTIDDALDVVIPTKWKKRLPRIF